MVYGNSICKRPDAVATGRWGHLLCPSQGNDTMAVLSDGLPWAIDNGAFSGFDEAKFTSLLSDCNGLPGCLWVACPDVVGNWYGTLDMFHVWRHKIERAGLPVAIVAQDGACRLSIPWSLVHAVFIGGTTGFKLSETSRDIISTARSLGKLAHMGRVNTMQRFTVAYKWGCTSIDGSSFHMFPDIMYRKASAWMDSLERQGVLLEG
jgi:hypothetical protein